MVVALTSPDGRYDSLYLSNYATLRVKDELSRIYGVGDVNVFGSSNYGMRIWLDPEKLKARDLTTEDVLAAIREQNVQVAAGQVGQPPSPADQDFQYTVTTLGRLSDPEQFGDIIVKAATRRRPSDAAAPARPASRTWPASSWAARSTTSGASRRQARRRRSPSSSSPAPTPSTWPTKVRKAHGASSSRSFPEGLEYSIPFNTTIFVEESIHEVYKTLFEAGVLVLIVILVFLQDWRAVLIPATTVPVTIIGAFAAMAALGFSVNMLTLFGLVLAIGIVVDDAIVIVENAAHHIDHDGLAAQGGHDQGDVRGDRAGHRHHARADGRVPADRVPRRDHRPALPPVRPDDRRHGRHQRHQRRDAQAGPVRHLPPADARRGRTPSTAASTPSTTGVEAVYTRDRPPAGPARRPR